MKAQIPLLFTLSLCACEQRVPEPAPPRPEAAPTPSTPAAGSLDLDAGPKRSDPQATKTSTSSAAVQVLSDEERADDCLYADAELRGVKNPALARSAVQNRARAKMKARLKELKASLTPDEQALLQSWIEGARVEVPRVQMKARGWTATARLDLSGLRDAAPALHTRLLAAGTTSAAGTP